VAIDRLAHRLLQFFLCGHLAVPLFDRGDDIRSGRVREAEC
jgi:hypothetical protein